MPKYFKNKKAFDEATKLIEKRAELFRSLVTKEMEEAFNNILTEKGTTSTLDDRDLLNMSYMLALDNPLMSDRAFEELALQMIDVFTPKTTSEELEIHKNKLIEEAKLNYENKLANIDKKKEEYEKYKKVEHLNKTKLEWLKNDSDINYIENEYKEILEKLNKKDFTINDLYTISSDYNFARNYIENLNRYNFKKISKTCAPYLDMLSNVRIFMSQNGQNLDFNKTEDCYKMISYGYLAQTFEIKSKEFKSYFTKDLNTLEACKEYERIDTKSSKVLYEIGRDFVELKFNANDPKYTTLTLGNFNQALCETPQGRLDNEDYYNIVTSESDGKIELNLREDSYKLLSDIKKYLKNPDSPKFEELPNKIYNAIANSVNSLIVQGSSDQIVSRNVNLEIEDKIYIDGKALSSLEPLKNLKSRDNQYHSLAKALLIKNILEGKHYIALSKFYEVKGKVVTDIVPIHVNHNKEAYLESRNFLYRFFHKRMNVQKYFDKKSSFKQEKIDLFNKEIIKNNLNVDSENKEYLTRKADEHKKFSPVSYAEFERELNSKLNKEDLNLKIKEDLKDNIINTNIEIDEKAKGPLVNEKK